MRLKCLHGFFIIDEQKTGEISRFASLFGLEIVPRGQYYTFSALAEAPLFSFEGELYLGAVATKTFGGEPWEVMRENSLIYDFNSGTVKRIDSITDKADLNEASNYFFSSDLLLPGSLTEDGLRVKDYTAWFSFDSMSFKYTEVGYD